MKLNIYDIILGTYDIFCIWILCISKWLFQSRMFCSIIYSNINFNSFLTYHLTVPHDDDLFTSDKFCHFSNSSPRYYASLRTIKIESQV